MIYFIQMAHTDCIKIGVAKNVRNRLAGLQCAVPYRLHLIASIEGSFSEEARIHRLLSKSRLEGEWFQARAALEILSHIRHAPHISTALSALESAAQIRNTNDGDVRRVIAKALVGLTATTAEIADALSVDACTVRRARKGETTLGLAAAFNLLDVDDSALDELAAAKGVRLVPMNARCDTDAMITTSAAVHSIAEARSPFSPGGTSETDTELLAMEGNVDAAIASLNAMKARIIAIKLRLAA